MGVWSGRTERSCGTGVSLRVIMAVMVVMVVVSVCAWMDWGVECVWIVSEHRRLNGDGLWDL